MLKRITNFIAWVVIGLYLAIVIILHIPYVQSLIGEAVGEELSKKFGTRVTLGRIDLGFANRLIIDELGMLDKNKTQMLKASRISLKIDPIALIKGQISFSSLQLFGLKANLYRANAQSKPNFQFVIDSLASKDKTQSKPLDLQISSIIIRHGIVKYRQLDKPPLFRHFSLNDLCARNISAHIILNKLSRDSINVKVKKIAFDEKSGLKIKKMAFELVANRRALKLSDFEILLPRTKLHLERFKAYYKFSKGKIEKDKLRFYGKISDSYLTPEDVSCFYSKLGMLSNKLNVNTVFSYTTNRLSVTRFDVFSSDHSLNINADGFLGLRKMNKEWGLNLKELYVSPETVKEIAHVFDQKFKLPTAVVNCGDIDIKGKFAGKGMNLNAETFLRTSAGNLVLDLSKKENRILANIKTDGVNMKVVTGNDKFGMISANLSITSDKQTTAVRGVIPLFEYSSYPYRNIRLDGVYKNKKISGDFELDDPNGLIALSGIYDMGGNRNTAKIKGKVRNLSPSALNMTDKWKNTKFDFDINLNVSGNNISNAVGNLEVNGFKMMSSEVNYAINNLSLLTTRVNGTRNVRVDSDFGSILLKGNIDLLSLPKSMAGLLKKYLPTIPIQSVALINDINDFDLSVHINNTKWMQYLLGISLEIKDELVIDGYFDGHKGRADVELSLPSFKYNGMNYQNAWIRLKTTQDDVLTAMAKIKRLDGKGRTQAFSIDSQASDNMLKTSVSLNDNEQHPLHGTIKASTKFFYDGHGVPTAGIYIEDSEISLGNTVWHVMPSNIKYNKNGIAVNKFSIRHDNQFISIDGKELRDNSSDSLFVNLNDVDISYILNIVNFHSVEFSGLASGQAFLSGLLDGDIRASASLSVKDFKFENGRMGTLYANVDLDNGKQINIHAVANDTVGRRTFIDGYVSPERNFIDLDIGARRTRAEFMESFCGSFMDNVEVEANGDVRLAGPLNNINLTGELVVDGKLSISSLNTTYTLKNDTIKFLPNRIIFSQDSIYDRNGNLGIVTGHLAHEHLTNLSYDINVKAENLLAYDTHATSGESFYGTVFATGDCRIVGRSGTLTIDVNATPEKGSSIVYNVSDRNITQTNDFIEWKNAADGSDLSQRQNGENINAKSDEDDISTAIIINFLVNCTPDAMVKVIMDNNSGDYISFNGSGALKAIYYNKGSFDIFGNYVIDNGLYKLSIKNLMKRDFTFQQGSTIKFGGNPFDASLNLKATYVLNSVSLADLNLGRSFSGNNIRVNCLMDVTGTPNSPKVNFDIDFPSLSADLKQMIYSIINAGEEKNQQVLYLLAVGRFYYGQDNNSSSMGDLSQQHNQTSLAMQSILSGRISQQLSSVLSTVVDNKNWNLGANISTGTEGLQNAEYEGLLSGRLLNNRLLVNGKFGYRDNANATTNFIGDFDLKYLLFPNGNMAITVYNKTNDRYFTRNSLNTQGIGLIMKKDFNGLNDLFGIRKKKKVKKAN